jgi:uncharacterized membrane protein YdjX (TVP38/TMEM64 family)
LLALAVFVVGLIAAGYLLGIKSRVSLRSVQSAMAAAGLWGGLLYLALFVLAELMHAPTIALMIAAALIYGRLLGGILAWSSSVIAVSVSFALIRAIGGQPVAAKHGLAKKLLAQLDDHPLRTVILLRMCFSTAPWLNYSLSLAGVRFRDNLLATALGIIPPLTLICLFTDFIVPYLLPHP